MLLYIAIERQESQQQKKVKFKIIIKNKIFFNFFPLLFPSYSSASTNKQSYKFLLYFAVNSLSIVNVVKLEGLLLVYINCEFFQFNSGATNQRIKKKHRNKYFVNYVVLCQLVSVEMKATVELFQNNINERWES